MNGFVMSDHDAGGRIPLDIISKQGGRPCNAGLNYIDLLPYAWHSYWAVDLPCQAAESYRISTTPELQKWLAANQKPFIRYPSSQVEFYEQRIPGSVCIPTEEMSSTEILPLDRFHTDGKQLPDDKILVIYDIRAKQASAAIRYLLKKNTATPDWPT